MKSILILVLILIMGFNLTGQNAHYNYSKSSVTGTEYAGGLIGYSPADTAAITNSYARGAVVGSRYVGGFIGANNGMILNSYSTGQVGGLGDLGGLAGLNSGTIEFSYWDINSSGISYSDGGEGRSTENMTYPEYMGTFIGWDFDAIWSHDLLAENDGYPLLKPVEVNRIQTRVFPPNVAVSSGDGFYPKNSEVVVSVQGSADYVFLGWFENGELLNNSLSYTHQVDGHTTLVARFRPRRSYQLTLEALAGIGGIVLGDGIYFEGEEVEIVAIPDQAYQFVSWLDEEGQIFSSDSVLQLIMPSEDLFLFAKFELVSKVQEQFWSKIMIYPNPASNHITIEFDQIFAKAEMKIFNEFGQLILSKNLINFNHTNVDLPFPDGVYLIQFLLNDEIFLVRKFVLVK